MRRVDGYGVFFRERFGRRKPGPWLFWGLFALLEEAEEITRRGNALFKATRSELRLEFGRPRKMRGRLELVDTRRP